jgi:hypothetical protein
MQRLDNNLATLKIVYDVVTLKTTMIIPYAAAIQQQHIW